MITPAPPASSSTPLVEHRFNCKVYYEDTDCGGVVYHANYLRFMERARTEMVGATGTNIVEWSQKGVTFVVYRVDVTFRAPARLGDELVVISSPVRTSAYRVAFKQRIEYANRESKALVKAEVEVVCIDPKGSLLPFPEDLGW